MKITLTVISKADLVQFKVTNTVRSFPTFYASNRIIIQVVNYPEVSGNVLYVQGENRQEDDLILSCTKEHYARIVEAVAEFNLSRAERQKIKDEADAAYLKMVNAEVLKRNVAFKSTNAAGKRVLIAKDVLKQIKDGRFVPAPGDWADLKFAPAENPWELNGESLRETFLSGKVESCKCCALGGLFTSCTLFKNEVTVKETSTINIGLEIRAGNKFKNGLDKIFPRKQLILIEHAFEKADGFFCEDRLVDMDPRSLPSKESLAKALKFGARYSDDGKRLIAIMRNIVKNSGTFNP